MKRRSRKKEWYTQTAATVTQLLCNLYYEFCLLWLNAFVCWTLCYVLVFKWILLFLLLKIHLSSRFSALFRSFSSDTFSRPFLNQRSLSVHAQISLLPLDLPTRQTWSLSLSLSCSLSQSRLCFNLSLVLFTPSGPWGFLLPWNTPFLFLSQSHRLSCHLLLETKTSSLSLPYSTVSSLKD